MEDPSKFKGTLGFNNQANKSYYLSVSDVRERLGRFSRSYTLAGECKDYQIVTPESLRLHNGVIPDKVAELMEQYGVEEVSFDQLGPSFEFIDAWLSGDTFDVDQARRLKDMLVCDKNILEPILSDLKKEFPNSFIPSLNVLIAHGHVVDMLETAILLEKSHMDNSQRLSDVKSRIKTYLCRDLCQYVIDVNEFSFTV